MYFTPLHTRTLATALAHGAVPPSPEAAELARVGLLKPVADAFRPRKRAIPTIATRDAEDFAAWFVGQYTGPLDRFRRLGFLDRGGLTEWGYNIQATIGLQAADLNALGDLVFGGTISDIGHHRLVRLGLITAQAGRQNIGFKELTSYGAAALIDKANQANHGA
jgi:hypothetical protein